MNALSNTNDNVKLKMTKKNYIKERQNDFHLNNEINSLTGGGYYSPAERLWRGKTQSFMGKTNPEENFILKEIMKKYQINQDELKGYNYKYVLQLSDLLGQKDKNFSKKRLELYNHRIELEKKQYSKSNGKFIKYQTAYKPKKQTNFFMEYFNGGNNKAKNFFIKNKLNNTLYKNGKKGNNNDIEFYNKTSYNYNSPNKFEKFTYLLDENNNKKGKSKYNEQKYNNMMYELNKNNEIEGEFDNTSLIGKEDFLVSGDKEKYHEYLKKEYNFFHPLKIRQMKYLFDKQKRIKLFKKLPNAKYLTYKKDNPLRIELFNKINREKQKLSYELPKSVNKKYQLNYDNKKDYADMKTKPNIDKEYQNIVNKLKKNFCIE